MLNKHLIQLQTSAEQLLYEKNQKIQKKNKTRLVASMQTLYRNTTTMHKVSGFLHKG